MKKILLLGLFALAFVCKISAQSNVTVFNQEGQKFWVVINGIKQNDTPQTNVQVSGLSEQNYKIKVIFENNNLPAIDKMIYTRDVDGNYLSTSYEVRKDNKGNYALKLSSYNEVPTATTPQYSAPLLLEERPATVNTNQTQTTTTIVTGNNQGNGGAGAITVVNAVDPVTGEVISLNMSVNGGASGVGGGVTTTTTVTTSSTTTTGNDIQQKPDHYIMQGYSGQIGCPWPMSESDFQSAKNSISSKSFEDSKLTVAKQILGSNCMLCSQVRDFMNLFSFETTKLDFAKFAYSRVFDQGNYYKLNDAFTFESSIDELNDFINKK